MCTSTAATPHHINPEGKRYERLRYLLVLLILGALTTLMPGWTTRTAGAAVTGKASASSEEVGSRGEGFQPEGKEKAQEEGKAAEKEEKQEEAKENECPATFGPIITDTAIPIEKGKFAIQPTFGLSFVTDVFNKNWSRVSAGGTFQSFNMSWKFTYGLLNNLEVYLVIPYIHNWASNVDEAGPRGERNSNFGGLGDVNFTLKYRLVQETETLPTSAPSLPRLFPPATFAT